MSAIYAASWLRPAVRLASASCLRAMSTSSVRKPDQLIDGLSPGVADVLEQDGSLLLKGAR